MSRIILIIFDTIFQVQSEPQLKYLYEAIADYAKRVQRGEKPMGDEKDVLLPEDNDDYVLDD